MDQILENDASEELKTTDIIAGESNKMDKIEDEIQTNSAMHTQRRIHLINKRNLYNFCCRHQGGRTWQAFGGGKHGHETFCQARIYNFRNKCNVFAHNLKFSILTQ